MNILFRADSSSTMGTGHIMRDLVLAGQYKDAKITFAAQELDGNINQKIIDRGYTLTTLESNDFIELDKLIKELAIDMLVIDHYGIDDDFEKQLKTNNTTITIMVLDDTYEKHYCDILLNHNVSANPKKYMGLVPEECVLKCGASYTLLRDEFILEKSTQIQKDEITTIYLSMGGSDAFNFNLKILHILKDFSNIQVYLTTTNANPHINELQSFASKYLWLKLYIDATNIAHLMNSSHFAIITPSVTVNEALFLEIPFISLKVINNQEDIHNYLCQHGFCAIDNITLLKEQIQRFINA